MTNVIHQLLFLEIEIENHGRVKLGKALAIHGFAMIVWQKESVMKKVLLTQEFRRTDSNSVHHEQIRDTSKSDTPPADDKL